jgi:hypothetical protein
MLLQVIYVKIPAIKAGQLLTKISYPNRIDYKPTDTNIRWAGSWRLFQRSDCQSLTLVTVF